jgi:hypothetical protein
MYANLVIIPPTNMIGMPTKQHQKYSGGPPKDPNEEKKLTMPVAMNPRPTTKMRGPKVFRKEF